MQLHPRACFQFFGLDFLIDDACHPWLLEANATPSMKVEHADPGLKRLIHQQKWPVVRDMFALLGMGPQLFASMETRPPDVRELTALLDRELAARGGFVPLFHLFPTPAEQPGLTIPWTRADAHLRSWSQQSQTYRTATR